MKQIQHILRKGSVLGLLAGGWLCLVGPCAAQFIQPGPFQVPQPQFGQPQFGQPQFGQPQFGQYQFGQPQFGQYQFGQPQFGQNQFGQPQFGQPQFGQPQFGQRGQVLSTTGPVVTPGQITTSPTGMQIKTLGSVTTYLGSFGGSTNFSTPSIPYSPTQYSTPYNPSPYSNPYNYNMPSVNYNNFSNPTNPLQNPVAAPLFQQQFNANPWNANPWNANPNNFMAAANPFLQFAQNGAFAPANNLGINPGIAAVPGNFGGIGGMGAGQVPGLGGAFNQGGFGGFGGFGGNPLFFR